MNLIELSLQFTGAPQLQVHLFSDLVKLIIDEGDHLGAFIFGPAGPAGPLGPAGPGLPCIPRVPPVLPVLFLFIKLLLYRFGGSKFVLNAELGIS